MGPFEMQYYNPDPVFSLSSFQFGNEDFLS
jgi:hypothetical protein